MIGVNSLLLAVVIVASLAVLFVAFKRTWARLLIIATMCVYGSFVLTLGMGGLRAHIEEARNQNHPESYVAGLAARNKRLLGSRLELAVWMLGMAAIGVAGVLAAPRKEG